MTVWQIITPVTKIRKNPFKQRVKWNNKEDLANKKGLQLLAALRDRFGLRWRVWIYTHWPQVWICECHCSWAVVQACLTLNIDIGIDITTNPHSRHPSTSVVYILPDGAHAAWGWVWNRLGWAWGKIRGMSDMRLSNCNWRNPWWQLVFLGQKLWVFHHDTYAASCTEFSNPLISAVSLLSCIISSPICIMKLARKGAHIVGLWHLKGYITMARLTRGRIKGESNVSE